MVRPSGVYHCSSSIYGSLKDRKSGDELLSRLGIECVENKNQKARSRCFGHVERKEENNWVKKCPRMNVTEWCAEVLRGKRGVVSRET